MHLDDVMIRRSSWSHYHADSARLAEQVADWMAPCCGWSASQRTAEVERYRGLAERSPVAARSAA